MTLIIVLQQVEVDGHDTVLIMNASNAFLCLFEHLTQQSFSESRRALSELVQIGLLTDAVDRFRPDGRGEI